MLRQVIANIKNDTLHLLYTENNINHPVAVVRDQDFQQFIIEAIQTDPELKKYIKAMIDRI